MRPPIISLILGLIAVITISIIIRDIAFVRVFSFIAISIFSYIAFQLIDKQHKTSRSPKLVITIGALSLLFLAFTNAPLRVAFLLVEPRFEALAEKLANGEPTHFPTRIGLFKIIDGGVREGSSAPYLMTSGHAYEIDGFVRDPKGTYFNLWSITPVSNRWAYIQED